MTFCITAATDLIYDFNSAVCTQYKLTILYFLVLVLNLSLFNFFKTNHYLINNIIVLEGEKR